MDPINEPDNSPFLPPFLQYDGSVPAIIEPSQTYSPNTLPRKLVLCFFHEVVKKASEELNAKIAFTITSEIGPVPVYIAEYRGQEIAFLQPGVGAPLCAGMFEQCIARGSREIIACGGCGVLDARFHVGSLFVPVRAVRDEGCSYHYLPPSEEIAMHPRAIKAICETLDHHGIPYLQSKTWTTDAFFRETPRKVAYFLQKDCSCVDMEASAFMAIAQFRGVLFGQILYAGDQVLAGGWDKRAWNSRGDIREQLFSLSLEACLNLSEES